jgi:hypothetical protein
MSSKDCDCAPASKRRRVDEPKVQPKVDVDAILEMNFRRIEEERDRYEYAMIAFYKRERDERLRQNMKFHEDIEAETREFNRIAERLHKLFEEKRAETARANALRQQELVDARNEVDADDLAHGFCHGELPDDA